MIILIFILTLTLISTLLIFFYSQRSGVVPLPSSSRERTLTLSILREDKYSEIQKIFDLGSGWGGLSRILSTHFPEKTITALEMSPVPFYYNHLLSSFMGFRNIQTRRCDFHKTKLQDKAAYLTYLSRPAMLALRKKFEKDLPQGGILISIAFSMPGWTASRIEYTDSLLQSAVYVYEF